MSKYTTGEMAKLCGISVRTVQYYDTRGILMPSELSDGGRRIYSENDLRRMKIICFLRDLDLPIDSIKKLLAEEHPEEVISLLLDSQEKLLRSESDELLGKIEKIGELRRSLRIIDGFSLDSLGDIAYMIQNKKKLRKMRIWMLTVGAVMDILEVVTVSLWIAKGWWLPFVLMLPVIVALGIVISYVYYGHTSYICPQCHTVFRPHLKDSFWARHTPNTRRLKCPNCSHHGFCVETYFEDEKTEDGK